MDNEQQHWREEKQQPEKVPTYYSKTTIYVFSILFNILFGGVLMSINLRDAGFKRERGQVIVLSILYFFLELAIVSKVPATLALLVVLNALGAFLLEHLFWNKYLGREILYKARPIWGLIAIGVVLLAMSIIAMLANGGTPKI